MKFIVVEIKQKNLYAIYDADNKGVCCCSAYTLAQLQAAGHTVIGFSTDAAGKLHIKECGLDGKPREKKAPVMCTDETKRSAGTIARGLDEKYYPRVKQERSSTQSVNTVNLAKLPQYNIALNKYLKEQPQVNVVLRNQQTVQMRVGDVFCFELYVCAGSPLQEKLGKHTGLYKVVGVITDICDNFNPTFKNTVLSYRIRMFTPELGNIICDNLLDIFSATSISIRSVSTRKVLYAYLANDVLITRVWEQYNKFDIAITDSELQQLGVTYTQLLGATYRPQFDKLKAELKQLEEQRIVLCNMLAQMPWN